MLSSTKTFGRSIFDILLYYEENHQELVKTTKRYAINFLGPFMAAINITGAGLSLSSVLSSDAMSSLRNSVGMAFISGGVLGFTVLVFIGSYWTWEFFRYDLALAMNPVYYDN